MPKDARRAVAWYLKAATQGRAAAQYNLALSYETGNGTSQNYAVAAKWYRMAAEQGDVDAQIGLAALYRYGLGVPADAEAAKLWYGRAAEQGDPRARFHLESLENETASRIIAAETLPAETPPAEIPTAETAAAESEIAAIAPAAPVQLAAAQSAAVQPAAGGGRFGVQLAAYRQSDGAEAAWNTLRAAHPDLLGGLEAAYLRTELADGGVVFRLVAGGFETKAAAGALCARLKQRDIDCFVPRP